jgi:hypothetical protein
VTTDRPLARPSSSDRFACRTFPARWRRTRMWLGAPPPWRADMIFGVFSFGVA